MKFTLVALIAVFVLPLTVKADDPATQPSRPMGARMREFKRDGLMPGAKPTQEEIDEAMAFMKDKAPNHYELFNRLPQDSPRRNRAEQILVMRYRNLMRVKDQAPEAYDAMLRQWQLEDQAIGFAREIKEGKQPDADVRLREVVRQMVQKNLDDRRARIERLRKEVDDLQKQLDQDEQNKTQLMSQLVTDTQNKFERLFGLKEHGGGQDHPDKPQEIDALPK
jgi:hypothetical protein